MRIVIAFLSTLAILALVRGLPCRHRMLISARINGRTYAVCWCGERFER